MTGTLGRQLLAGASFIFLLGLAGVGGIYFSNARTYLQEQLQSHAQDAATSLGLSLGTGPAPDDAAFAETVINAVFDRGYYERITFVSASGKIVVNKELAATESEVPAWFVRFFPLQAPTAASLVTNGWRQMGQVLVTSHPRFAYRQLWRTAVETTTWLAIIAFLGSYAMRLFLASILRPLQRIEQAADAIGKRDYQSITVMPRARELRQVVQAINSLSARVRETIEAETARAESLRREAFLDPLTGLWNRRGFVQQYDARIREDRDVHAGLLALLEFDDFARFNRAKGYERGDDLLKLVASAIEDIAVKEHATAGRWAGATLVLAAANLEGAAAQNLVADLCSRIEALLSEQGYSQDLQFNCGAATFESEKPELGAMLARADGALMRARSRGAGLFEVETAPPAGPAALGSMDWRRRLEDALAAQRIVLYQQAVMALPAQQPFHVEITARLLDEKGEAIPATQFLPMAVRHQLVARLDRTVLELLFARIAAGPLSDATVAVNVSAHSITAADFVSWLRERLALEGPRSKRLTFEMPESGAMRNSQAALAFAQAIRERGARFALDNFGVHRESIQTLQRLLPDYVKLSASYTAGLREDASKRFFVASLVRIARTLDIAVIAQAVEDPGLLPLLSELGISGFQGYASAVPKPL